MREVVITPMGHIGPPRRSRTLQERVWVRFPSLYRRQTALVFRLLPPGSRLRQTLLRQAFLSGWASVYRQDLELNLLFYSPEAEYEFPTAMHPLGLGGPFRGHAGRIDVLDKIAEVWGSIEIEPAYMIELARDGLLFLGFLRNRGRASGIQLEHELAQLITLRDGLVIRDQNFFSWEEGLRATGLEPDAVALTKPAEAAHATSNAGQGPASLSQ